MTDLANILFVAAMSSAVGAIVGGAVNTAVWGRIKQLQREVADLRDDEIKRINDDLTKAAGSRKGMHEKLERDFVKKADCWHVHEEDRTRMTRIEADISDTKLLVANVDRETSAMRETLDFIKNDITLNFGTTRPGGNNG